MRFRAPISLHHQGCLKKSYYRGVACRKRRFMRTFDKVPFTGLYTDKKFPCPWIEGGAWLQGVWLSPSTDMHLGKR